MKLEHEKILHILKDNRELLNPGSYEFAMRVFSENIDKYTNRLRQIGITRSDRVLDAGCGFGQWSIAIAMLGAQVQAMDTSSDRLFMFKSICQALGFTGVDIKYGSISDPPYDDGIFDKVFCYGAIFLTPWKNALEEFFRILKPGGLIYTNANEIGYYLHLWKSKPNRSQNYDPRRSAAYSICNNYRYSNQLDFLDGRGTMVEQDEFLSEMKRIGYIDIQQGPEGTLVCEEFDGTPGPSFFKGEYDGLPGVFEVIARKP